MIIAALVKRYEQQLKARKVVGRGWSMTDISFGLRLYENGEIADVIDLRTEVEGNQKNYLKPIKMAVPEQVRRSSNILSSFLCDNADYFFGINGKIRNFEVAKKLHLEVLRDCDSRASRAIKNFFRNWNPSEMATHTILQAYLKELQKGARFIFMFEEKFATEYDEIRTAWEDYWQNQGKSPLMRCSITGKKSSFIARIHP
ncbi:MAG: type I-C CRISPR-associated protein Cas8c/Csd1, partial [Selenomonadaceae bacterium]|nr:type I-C CRISPR-associated protein Cas8c/Csd1 [Selenomonadaceae bacterium]